MSLQSENKRLTRQNKKLKETIAEYEDKFKKAKVFLNEQLAEIEKRGSDD